MLIVFKWQNGKNYYTGAEVTPMAQQQRNKTTDGQQQIISNFKMALGGGVMAQWSKMAEGVSCILSPFSFRIVPVTVYCM